MRTIPKTEVFSLLRTDSQLDMQPADAAHQLFREMRPSLEAQPWDPKHSYAGQNFIHQGMDVEADGFTGSIAWHVDGDAELTLQEHPDARKRVEERLHVHSAGWRQQAEITFIRNVLTVGVIDLDATTHSQPHLWDLRDVTVGLEANAPNQKDRLHVAYGASSGFKPKGYLRASSRTINSTPQTYEQIDVNDPAAVEAYLAGITHENSYNPTKADLAELRTAVALLSSALQYLRTTPAPKAQE